LQTTALMASGVYLLAVAAAGYLVREIGLAWGATMQIVLLAAAGLTLASLLTSGQARARFRHFVAENFFAVLFDYRREWMRFVETMENPDSGKSLYERAVRAIAQPFDCSGGALYLRGHGERYELAANDTWRTARNLPELPEALVDEVLAAPQGYLPLDTETPSAAVAALRAELDRPRFAVPLRHRGRALGVIVVGHARVARPLSWEARDVLGVLARQVAGYLAEEQTTRQLMAAQKFERVSRTFSYVAHDLKNVVSQLGVVVKRAEKYGDDPEFQRDAMETVAHAVESMNALLARIRDGEEGANGQGAGRAGAGRARADVTAIAADVARRRGLKTGHVTFSAEGDDLWGRADGKQLAAVLDNLVQNALDASAVEGAEGRAPVHLRVRAGEAPGFVAVEVQDQGCGMTPAFVRETLFQPFASTKADGFGLGMYQCREWVEGWGGRLEIESVYGAGTTARVVLPASAGPDAANGPSATAASPRAQASTTKEALAHG
jgi:putative PEP-CTERM system histidine kinase